MKDKVHSFITQLNESVNLLGFFVIVYAPFFVYLGAKDLAGQLVAGAIGLMGGKALNQAATRRAADFPDGTTISAVTNSTVTSTTVPPENNNAKTDSGTSADPAPRGL